MLTTAVWLQKVKEELGDKLNINWKYFSLDQVHNHRGPRWKVWEQEDDYPSAGIWAFRAAEAARRQGQAAFDSFHYALLKARHEQGLQIANTRKLVALADKVGLDITRFQEDLNDHSSLAKIAEDHTSAVEKHRVFGTSTLVFPGGKAVFVKLASPPPPAECLPVFNEVRRMAEQREYVREIKRT